jgi:hypothetical protein
MKILAPLLSIFLLMPVLTKAQGEYDDLYYTPADRESERKSYQTKIDNTTFTQPSMNNSLADNSYPITTPSINNRINNTSQGRTVNPEYVAQYRSRSDARKQNSQENDEIYYDENYKTEYYEDTDDRGTIINNYNYYGSGSMMANRYHDPFYSNRWRYNDWRMRAYHYDPFFDPFFMPHTPGWAVNVSLSFGHYGGWYGNRWSRWSYDPWYSPYYGGGYHHYSNYYNPYGYRPAYYNNVVYINNEYNNNSSLRRGPATSRGSVINSRRSVANEGPVRRIPVKRSSLDDDANGRVGAPSAVSSGRVIERSGVQTRSPRDYSNVQERSRERSTIERSTVTPRNNRTNVNRNNTPARTTPQRNSVDRSENDNRSNRTIDRSNTNQRRTAPSRSETRRENNSNRYTPSRSNDNRSDSRPSYSAPQRQRSQPSYSPPQRSSSPSYNRGGGSSRGSSVTPSRSTSSPSRGTSGRSRR